ncbi:hypothetical protein QBC37DRAFT_201991 [Rhypophila decipiens]|uniref:Uncharacterized protein n=1 Tax=Rhypophila decipiens TaxID=261697 RepID=A0AAN6Y6B9_9PEZI|nr:hypothetical protein QBC37DRAFT_201991 [Rhypophila decipiens]
MAWPDKDTIQMIEEVTMIKDHALLARALKKHGGDAEKVVDEFCTIEGSAFAAKYGDEWAESAFTSNREGHAPTSAPNPAFRIESEDPVLYGTTPGARPPSRADARSQSPLSWMGAQLATGNVETVDTRAAQARYETDYEVAIWLSRRDAARAAREAKSQLVPAERSEYPDIQWAVAKYDPDPAPPDRKKIDGIPVFLRCRSEEHQHRVGGLLTVFHSIPGMRNALLRIKAGLKPGERPGEKAYGYGKHPEWWKGQLILPPELQQTKDWLAAKGSPGADNIFPPWEDELHRLVAFLDLSHRSYGTADILARCRLPNLQLDGESPESAFLINLKKATAPDISTGDDAPGLDHWPHCFVWDIKADDMDDKQTIYDLWDTKFFREDDPVAPITCPPEVFVFRFGDQDGSEDQKIEIPETFFIDRYLEKNRDKVLKSRQKLKEVEGVFGKIYRREAELGELGEWVNPRTGKTLDRKVLLEKSIEDCRRRIASIRKRAVWREHEENRSAQHTHAHCQACDWDRYPPEDDPQGRPEATLDPDEQKHVQFYEGKIRQMQKSLADIEHPLKKIQAEKAKLRELVDKLKLTDPKPDIKWNPTNKYTLMGIVPNTKHLFIRIREQGQEPEVKASNQWIEMRFQDNTVSPESVSFEHACKQSLGRGESPYFIYATEKAMAEEPALLTDALNTFVRLDNGSFKEELDEYEASKTPLERKLRKRRSGCIDDTISSESKRIQRSPSTESVDSMKPEPGDDQSLYDVEEKLARGVRESLAMTKSVSAEQVDSEMADVFGHPPEQEATSPDAGGGGLKGGSNRLRRLKVHTPKQQRVGPTSAPSTFLNQGKENKKIPEDISMKSAESGTDE